MAIETLRDDTSSIESDCWSFGVLLFEIFSLGLRPYTGLQNHEIYTHIEEGNRLKRPALCPQMVYKLMLECWDNTPARRPLFADVFARLCAEAEAERSPTA